MGDVVAIQKVELKAGDLFCTANPMALGRAINFMQAAAAYDGQSIYSHSGIITDADGTTFEALWKLERNNLFDSYSGKQVVIARFVGSPRDGIRGMDGIVFKAAFSRLYLEHEKQWYPGWRLFFHVIPSLAKLLSFKGHYVVCSELTAKFLYYAHEYLLPQHDCKNLYCWPRHKWFTGTCPDMLADEWHRWIGYKIIYEKVLDKNDFLL